MASSNEEPINVGANHVVTRAQRDIGDAIDDDDGSKLQRLSAPRLPHFGGWRIRTQNITTVDGRHHRPLP